MRWLRRLRRTFTRGTNAGIADEIRFHIDARTEALVRDGMPADQAGAAARRRFGNVTALEEQARDVATLRWLRDAADDLRLAFRMVRRHAALAATVVATLALGIGATTAIFSAVYAVLLRPLPYAAPDRLVAIWTRPEADTAAKMTVRFVDFEQWRRQVRRFSGFAGWAWFGGDTILTGRGAPRSVLGVAATADLFQVLGARAALGRTFDARDLDAGCVVVLAHRFWQSVGSDSHIGGTTLRLNDRACTVVGVMPASFVFFPVATDLWTLITPTSDIARNPAQSGVAVVGRLASGATAAAAASELRALAVVTGADIPPGVPRMVPIVNDLQQEFTWMAGPNLRVTLLVLLAAVGGLLAIACMNVANLLLGRAILRRREVAVRTAVGCSRGRLWRQLTAEGLLLGVAGAAAGAVLAIAALRLLRAVDPVPLPPGSDVSISVPVLAFAAVVGIVVGVIAGALPAWRVSGVKPAAALAEGGRTAPLSGRQILARSLIVAQAMLSLVLLVGAVLLMQSVARFGSTSLGFDPDGLVSYRVVPPSARYGAPAARARLYQRLADAFAAEARTGALAISTTVPPRTEGPVGIIEREGAAPPDPRRSLLDTAQQSISANYFDVMSIPLQHGRAFGAIDTAASPAVCIVNAALVRRYFNGGDAIGRRIRFAGLGTSPWLTIVGVVGDEKRADPRRELGWLSQPIVYRPFAQRAAAVAHLVVRADSRIDASDIERIARGVEPELLVGVGAPVDRAIADYFRFPQFRAELVSVFAGVALLLAIVGLYGVLAQAVAQRTRDIGVRMALGASQWTVVGSIIREALLLAALGVAGGLLLIVPVKGILGSLLYGVGITNLMALGGAAATLVMAALCASYVPARRASRVDPVIALRTE